MLKLIIPRDLLDWIDECRGPKGRAAFVVDCVRNWKEVVCSEMK